MHTNEIRPISGKITDIAWDGESKRLMAVGEGRERFGHAFTFDTLSSVGEVTGHSKVINSVSIRHQRPFRAVTASDDLTVAFFHGVPFKYVKSIHDHTRFVHSVEFSPDGEMFASAGADGKIFVYDGKTGDKLDELSAAENSHTGSIFALSWSDDSTHLLSSSADCTAKIWDVKAKTVLHTFTIDASPNPVENQQVGNLWKGDYLITASLSGDFHYLDKNTGKITRHVSGHAKAITAITVSEQDTLFTGSYDGRVCHWKLGQDSEHTSAFNVEGNGHANQITALLSHGDQFASVAMDDTLRLGSTVDCQYSNKMASTSSLPLSVSVSQDDVTVVATAETVEVYNKDLKKIGELEKHDYTPSVAAITPNGKTVFVGSKILKNFKKF
ncbi:hypothetical protein G6F56_010882 [Rhizopus delemar]|nr:hypothetical protein G6F56_010882 [Rhizopus delemar]